MNLFTTLVEGSHFIGVAALFNSLVASGFEGPLVVGYRGAIPAWFDEQSQRLAGQLPVSIELEPMSLEGHMTNLKPHWMLSLVERRPDAEQIVYADPDICIVGPWRVIEDWIGDGVALVENNTWRLPLGHWRLTAWRRFMVSEGLDITRELEMYANGGFVGVARGAVSFLERWRLLGDRLADDLGGHHISALPGGVSVGGDDRYNAFSHTDQDVLNCAMRCGDEPLHLAGPDAMGFDPGVPLMTHALGPNKPWNRRFVREAVGGRKPSFADKTFFNYCHGPMEPFTRSTLWRKRAAVKLACAIRGRGWS